jgi:hypothetical protein
MRWVTALISALSVISLLFFAKYLIVPSAVGNLQSTIYNLQSAVGGRQLTNGQLRVTKD